MFEYFPGNYVWNLGVVATLNSGGLIDEVDRACRPIKDAAARGEDAGTPEFLGRGQPLTEQLVAQAEAAEKAGHRRTAGQQYARATNYLCQAERMQSAKAPNRLDTYRRVLELQQKAFDLKDPRLVPRRDPLRGDDAAGVLQPGAGADDGPAPVMILWNGLDSTKEHMYSSGHWEELAARGISVPHGRLPRLRGGAAPPGPHGAGRHRGLGGGLRRLPRHPAGRRPAAIGLVGWSLGGYYAPRAAAFEKRLALVVAWGANHDWGAVQKRRLEREGENPVPHYWDHVLWVWGYDDIDDVHRVRRAGQPRRRRREDHRAVPRRARRRTTGRSRCSTPTAPTSRPTASPKRELRIFTAEEGATEHIGLDHLPHVSTYIADWVADTFAELAARALTSIPPSRTRHASDPGIGSVVGPPHAARGARLPGRHHRTDPGTASE